MAIKDPKFNIEDEVYHITKESPKGIILDIRYSYLTKIHEYFVTFGCGVESLWYYGHELTSQKIY